MRQCICLQCINMHADIHSARATHFPASNMPLQGVHAKPAEDSALSSVLSVKLLELELVFGFFRHKRVSKDSGPN